MKAPQISQDLSKPFKKGMPRRPRFMKEITLLGEASETPQNPDKESRELSSEEDHLNVTDFDTALEQSCMEPEDMLKTPEIVGKLLKFCTREFGSEDKAVLLGEWQEDVLTHEEKSFSWQERAAYQHEKRTCAQSSASEEGQQDGKLAFPRENAGESQKRNPSHPTGVSCWSSEDDDTQRKRRKTESNVAPAKLAPSGARMTKVKPCCVVLEDISSEIKAKGRFHLMVPKARTRSAKIQKKNSDKLKKLQVILTNVVEKNSLEKQRETVQVKSVATLLSKEKIIERNNFLKLNKSAELPNSSGVMGSGKMGSHPENQERETSGPDIDMLCDQGLFARLSLVDSKGGDAAQPEPIKFLSSCHGKMPEMEKTNSADASGAFCSRAKFSKMPLGELSVSALPSEANCGDPHKAHSDFESCSISPFSGGDCKRDMEDGIPRGTLCLHPSPWDEKEIEGGQTVREEGGSPCSSRVKDEDDCWFLLKLDEVVEEEEAAEFAKEEEERLRELERGVFSFGCSPGLPQAEDESTCQPLLDDIGALQPSEDEKRRTPRGHNEIRDGESKRAEENMIPQPSEETSPAEEEEILQSHLSRSIRTVFYKLSGSAVKLLGTPSDRRGALGLGRIPELEDSAWDKVHILRPSLESTSGKHLSGPTARTKSDACQDTVCEDSLSSRYLQGKKNKDVYISVSAESTEKEKPLSGTKPSCLDGTKTKKWTREPRMFATPIPSSLISQEQTRLMVVDALRETLQKRLDASPELKVEMKTVSKVAKKVERELFRLFCCVGQHYKNKYRSLLFNLKSTENQQLFRRVMLGEITPRRLVQMTSLEMAPQELIEWRARENQRVLEMIKKEEQEAPLHCTAKFTHKGIVEIHREEEADWMPQEMLELQLHREENSSSEILTAPARDPRWKIGGRERRFKLSTCKANLNQKETPPKHSHSSIMCSEDKGRLLKGDSPDVSGVPKKNRRLESESRSSAVWKGLIQMFSVKKFMAKAYLVSGSSRRLAQVLPRLLWSRGCILPEDVWAYLDSIWPSSIKDAAVIRFQPSISRDLRYYSMLYTYLNDKQRYGIVDSHQMEIFVVPVAAYQPVPSQLRPLGGQGLDPSHPSLLLGIILPKRTSTRTLETVATQPVPEAQGEAKSGPCLSAPPFQADSNPSQPPGPWCRDEAQGERPSPGGELFTVDTLYSLTEQLGRQMRQADPSWCQREGPCSGAGQGSLSDLFLPLNVPPWAGEQLGSGPLGSWGDQPCQSVEHVQPLCMEPNPSPFWNTQGFLLPSEMRWLDHHRAEGAPGENTLETPFLQGPAGPPAEPAAVWPLPRIPGPGAATEELVEETLSLLEQMTQLQAGLQSGDPQPPSAPSGFLAVSPEVASVLSQAAMGLDVPPAQHDPDIFAHLQLLLSALSGPPKPPSAL